LKAAANTPYQGVSNNSKINTMAGNFTCKIVEDQSAQGNYCYADNVLLEGTLTNWPKSISPGRLDHLRLVLNAQNWEKVKDALGQLKPYENSTIPRDLGQYISEANMPSACKIVGPVWKKAVIDRRRSKNKPPVLPTSNTRASPSTADSEAAAKLAEEANKVRLPEPSHIPESAFLANNPTATTFKFPKVDKPDTESAFARVASVAQAEVAAELGGTKIASEASSEEDEEEEEELSTAGSFAIDESSEDGNDDDDVYQPSDDEEEDPLWDDDPREKIVKGSNAHIDPFDDCTETFRAQKEAQAIGAASPKVNILQARKKERYGGKHGSRTIAGNKKKDSPRKKRRVNDDDDSDYADNQETKSSKKINAHDANRRSTRASLKFESPANGSLTLGSPSGSGLTFHHHVKRDLPSSALKYKLSGSGSSRLAGSRPKTIRQQMDSKVRQKVEAIQSHLETAQRMSTPILRSDSFDPNNTNPEYLEAREKEATFPVTMHMAATYTEQVRNGDGQNRVGEIALQKPRLYICLDSETNQKAFETALKSGNLEVHTFNHFPDYAKQFKTGIKRGQAKKEETDDESVDYNRLI